MEEDMRALSPAFTSSYFWTPIFMAAAYLNDSSHLHIRKRDQERVDAQRDFR